MSDGNIWVGTSRGVYAFDPLTQKTDCLSNHPQLKELNNKLVISLFEDNRHRLWIGTMALGIYCYDPAQHSIINLTTKEGLPGDIIYGFTQDNAGAVYAGTAHGFVIIDPQGKDPAV